MSKEQGIGSASFLHKALSKGERKRHVWVLGGEGWLLELTSIMG